MEASSEELSDDNLTGKQDKEVVSSEAVEARSKLVVREKEQLQLMVSPW